jgi:hypothetical protein
MSQDELDSQCIDLSHIPPDMDKTKRWQALRATVAETVSGSLCKL